MVKLRSYKFLVAPVVQIVDEDGTVTGEVGVDQPDQIFGVQGLIDYAERFDDQLERQQLATRNGAAG